LAEARTPASAPVVIIAVIAAVAALYLSRSVAEPIGFALVVIALANPLQAWLRARMPAGLALLLTVVTTLAVIALLGYIIIWSVSHIAQWVVAHLPRFQQAYGEVMAWLVANDLYAPGLTSRFNPAWVTGPLLSVLTLTQGAVGFIMLAFVFLVLGLKEAPGLPDRLRHIGAHDMAALGGDLSGKLGRYMAVRAAASVLTGVGTAIVAWLIGIDEPVAWGVLSFALNFIPFIGPLIAVILMTLFAAAQFVAWQQPLLVIVFVTVVQFGIGSYLEPIMAGTALSISPFMVLVAVFFWGMLWGIPGAFLGVPIVILLLSLFEGSPSLRWLGFLLSGRDPPKA
jgi:predicted PurR-regulated permease PerM